jgi:hypothetical protein
VVAGNVEPPLLWTLGQLLSNLFVATAIRLLLAFPSGRLQTTVDRVLVGIAYVATTVLWRPFVLFTDPVDLGCAECPEGGGHHQRPDPVVWSAVPGEQAHPGESGTDDEVEDDPKAAIVQEVGPSEQRHEPESDRRGHDGHHRELRPGQPHPPSPMASRDMSALTIDRTPAGAKVEPSRGLQRCPPV